MVTAVTLKLAEIGIKNRPSDILRAAAVEQRDLLLGIAPERIPGTPVFWPETSAYAPQRGHGFEGVLGSLKRLAQCLFGGFPIAKFGHIVPQIATRSAGAPNSLS